MISPNKQQKTLFVFADETGDDRFDEDGTTYFGIAAVMTATPHVSAAACQALVYDLLAEGISRRRNRDEPIVAIHATYDPPPVRQRVFAMIDSVLDGMEVHIAYVDKRKANPAVRTRSRLYRIVAGAIAKYIAKRANGSDYDRVVFAFDQALPKKEMSAFNEAVKPALKAIGIPYTLVFHQLGHEPNGQISDYIAWAWRREMEYDESQYLHSMPTLRGRLSQCDLFERGSTYYYGVDKNDPPGT